MKIIGFDPGTNITGFGILEKKNDKIIYIQSGIIDLRKYKNIQLKLSKIYEKIIEIGKRYKPDAVALEDVFVAKNTKSTIKLGYVKGIIFLAASHLKLDTFEYSPTSIKLSITGYGRATKDEIRKMLPNIIDNLNEKKSADECDAIAIAYCHIVNNDCIFKR